MKKILMIFLLLVLIGNIGFCQSDFLAIEVEYVKNYDGDTFTAFVYYPSDKLRFDYKKKRQRFRIFACDTVVSANDVQPHRLHGRFARCYRLLFYFLILNYTF